MKASPAVARMTAKLCVSPMAKALVENLLLMKCLLLSFFVDAGQCVLETPNELENLAQLESLAMMVNMVAVVVLLPFQV
jgi:hypothetical protein